MTTNAPLTLKRLDHNVLTLTIRDPVTKAAINLTAHTIKFRGFTSLADPDGTKVAAFTKDVTEATDIATTGDITDPTNGVVKFTWTKANMSTSLTVSGDTSYYYGIKKVDASSLEETVQEGPLYIERETVA